jgi:hypothetical protein
MAWYSRVNEKGHLAEKAADVRPADADSMDADECLAGPRLPRLFDVDLRELFRGLELDGFHGAVGSGGNRKLTEKWLTEKRRTGKRLNG